MSFFIAAAGTGGHIFPALAVAEELHGRGHGREAIVFLGGQRLEAVAVPAAGFPLVALDIRGLRRSLSLSNIQLPWVVRRAAADAARELRERNARVVLAMGGYVTIPAALAARRVGVPLVVHEQNAVPGLANRLVRRSAERLLVAFPAAAARMKGAAVVGNPVSAAIAGFDRARLRPVALQRYGFEAGTPVLGVLGGSLGARAVNEAIVALLTGWSGPPLSVLHLAGRDHVAAVGAHAERSQLRWVVLPFEDSMEYFYAAADLVVSRAGAITVSELAATGTPAVLVPLEAVAQEGNAEFLAGGGGARVVRQAEVARLPEVVGPILADPGLRASMAAAGHVLGKRDAAQRVADVVEEVAA